MFVLHECRRCSDVFFIFFFYGAVKQNAMMDDSFFEGEHAVECTNLNFSYPIHGASGLKRQVLFDVSLKLKRGARCILVGANGAGKSTLLRVLAGKHLVAQDTCIVLGKPAFLQTEGLSGITFLGNGTWSRTIPFAGRGIPYQADIPVSKMMLSLQNQFPERRDELMEILEIDPEWRMHEVSDGQRRRVQIMLGLLRPFKLLLVDEMTVDLDALARKDFLTYLKSESETRGATIVYATHIFDGMEHADFSTCSCYMEAGKVLRVVDRPDAEGRMYQRVVAFLEKMRKARRALFASAKKKRAKVSSGSTRPVDVEPFARRENSGWTSGRFAVSMAP